MPNHQRKECGFQGTLRLPGPLAGGADASWTMIFTGRLPWRS